MSTEGVQPRDERSYTEFVLRCRPELLRFIRHLGGPECDHEAVVQETLERAWRGWPDIRDPRPWAFRVAARMVWSDSLSGKAEQSVPRIPSKFRWVSASALPDINLVMDTLLIQDEIRSLSPRQRAAVYLFHVEGWSYREIAQLLGCSQSSVGVHIYRGTQAIRNALSAPRATEDQPSTAGPEAKSKPWWRNEGGYMILTGRRIAIGWAVSGFWLICIWLKIDAYAAVLTAGVLFSSLVLRIRQVVRPRRVPSIGQQMIALQEVVTNQAAASSTPPR